jgi:hypothetical protein
MELPGGGVDGCIIDSTNCCRASSDAKVENGTFPPWSETAPVGSTAAVAAVNVDRPVRSVPKPTPNRIIDRLAI